MSFEERMPEAVSPSRNYGEQPGIALARMEDRALEQFHRLIETEILPLFHTAARLLKDHCTVLIRRQEHATGGTLVVSVGMIVTAMGGARNRRVRQPYPKLEICLRRKTLQAVIFTEQARTANLQIEQIALRKLNATKLEQCVYDFIMEIFR